MRWVFHLHVRGARLHGWVRSVLRQLLSAWPLCLWDALGSCDLTVHCFPLSCCAALRRVLCPFTLMYILLVSRYVFTNSAFVQELLSALHLPVPSRSRTSSGVQGQATSCSQRLGWPPPHQVCRCSHRPPPPFFLTLRVVPFDGCEMVSRCGFNFHFHDYRL